MKMMMQERILGTQALIMASSHPRAKKFRSNVLGLSARISIFCAWKKTMNGQGITPSSFP
jgi:hypothetical protein